MAIRVVSPLIATFFTTHTRFPAQQRPINSSMHKLDPRRTSRNRPYSGERRRISIRNIYPIKQCDGVCVAMLSLRGTCAQPPPFRRCATLFGPKPESGGVWQRARDRNDDPDDHSTELRTDPSTAQNRNLPKSRSRRCALPSQKPGSATLKPPQPTAHHTNPSESQLPLHHRQSRNHKQNPIANRRTRLPLRHFQIPPSDFSMALKTHFTGHIRQWFRNPPLRKAKRTP